MCFHSRQTQVKTTQLMEKYAHTHTHKLTHRCRVDEWQRKDYKRNENNDDVVFLVPQPLKGTPHDSPLNWRATYSWKNYNCNLEQTADKDKKKLVHVREKKRRGWKKLNYKFRWGKAQVKLRKTMMCLTKNHWANESNTTVIYSFSCVISNINSREIKRSQSLTMRQMTLFGKQ